MNNPIKKNDREYYTIAEAADFALIGRRKMREYVEQGLVTVPMRREELEYFYNEFRKAEVRCRNDIEKAHRVFAETYVPYRSS